MKQLHEYETPEIDELEFDMLYPTADNHWKKVICSNRARNLEQRLAACREFISNAVAFGRLDLHAENKALAILTLTAPK